MMRTETITTKFAAAPELHQNQPVLEMEWTRMLNLVGGQLPVGSKSDVAELEERIWDLQLELDELEDELRRMRPHRLTPAVEEQVRTLLTLHDQWGIERPAELQALARCLPEYQEVDVEED